MAGLRPVFCLKYDIMKFILGKKLGMSTIYDEQKGALNVTLVECVPNVITQIRTEEKDGYDAIQMGMKHEKPKAMKKIQKEKRIQERSERIESRR